MKITEIYIKSFGGLSDFKLFPCEGHNVFFGPNESGKTTVMSFLRAMLFGAGNKNDIRGIYKPWDDSTMSGYLKFSHKGISYRLDRTFGATQSKDIVELRDMETGECLSIPLKTSVGEFLLGITEESFMNTVYIGQLAGSIKGKNSDILRRLTNLATSSDETISKNEVSDRLSNAAKKIKSRSSSCELEVLSDKKNTCQKLKNELELTKKKLCEELELSASRPAKIAECEQKIKNLTEIRSALVLKARLDEISRDLDAYNNCMKLQSQTEDFHTKAVYHGRTADEELLSDMRETLRKSELLEANIDNIKNDIKNTETDADSLMSRIKSVDNIASNLSEIEAAEDGQTPCNNSTTPKKLRYASIGTVCAIMLISIILCLVLPWYICLSLGVILSIIITAVFYVLEQKPITKDINSELLQRCSCSSLAEAKEQAYYLRSWKEKKLRLDECHKILESLKDELEQLNKKYPDITYETVSSLRENLSRYNEARVKYEYSLETLKYISPEAISELQAETENINNELTSLHVDEKLDISSCDIAITHERDKITELNVRSEQDKKNKLDFVDTVNKIKSLNDEIDRINQAAKDAEFRYSALTVAAEALDDAFENMQRNFCPKINKRAGEYLSLLTKGKYDTLLTSKQLIPSVTTTDNSKIMDASLFSGGTTDQIYLALRIAIADLIFEDGDIPLILDDPLVQYDDTRAKEAVKVFDALSDRYQILRFTCHERDAAFGGQRINLA